MPCGPFTDPTVLDFLGTKVVGNDPLLIIAPAFFDLRIIVIRFGHCSISFLNGGAASFVRPPNELLLTPPAPSRRSWKSGPAVKGAGMTETLLDETAKPARLWGVNCNSQAAFYRRENAARSKKGARLSGFGRA